MDKFNLDQFNHQEISKELTTIILAGGKSSRMGREKALIPIAGIPLIRRVYNVARELSPPENIYIVLSQIVLSQDMRSLNYQSVLPPDCQYIYEQESFGPLVGFAQVLHLVKTPWILLLACDLPNLRTEIFQQWQQQLIQVDKQAIAALARHPKGWEPLCGFYRQSAQNSLAAFIAEGGKSFQNWLQQNSVHELQLAPSQTDIFFNCNTPEDLQPYL